MQSTNESKLVPTISVYLGGLVIGLTLVSFPASSAVMKDMHGFSDAEYGAIYLPQLIAAVAGALVGGVAVRRFRLISLYLVALCSFALAQLLLAASAFVAPLPALVMIMAATASFGFGFGYGGGPLNGFAALLYPNRTSTAVTALHMCAGAGLTIGPALFAHFAAAGMWLAGPVGLLALTIFLLVISLMGRFPDPAPVKVRGAEHMPARSAFFWLCAAIAMIYSIAEGTFSNWAILYLQEEREVPLESAALALTAFWGALTVGRLLASFIVIRLSATTFLLTLPLVMAVAFLLLPQVSSAQTGIEFFALAGLACSAFFPMLVAFTADRFPTEISWIASMLTAAMMVGVGIGSYLIGALRGTSSIAHLYMVSLAYPAALLVLVFAARRTGYPPLEARRA